MATILITTLLIPLLSSTAFLPATAEPETITFTYDFYGDQPKELIYQGDAHFPKDTTYLRLTKTDDSLKPQRNSVGRVINPTPIPFGGHKKRIGFETTVKFIIRPANDSDSADGLVFFMAPEGTTIPPGSSGKYFGVFNSSGSPSTWAFEFDIYVNNDVDPNSRHIGIDIKNVDSVKYTTIDDETSLGKEVTVLIDYQDSLKLITAKVTFGNLHYEVSYEQDLHDVLTQPVQAGLAASTGEYVATHDVIAWYFTGDALDNLTDAGKEDVKIRQYV